MIRAFVGGYYRLSYMAPRMAPRREASFNCEIIGQLTTTDLTTCSREGVEDARSRLMKLNVPIRITISELAYTRALLEERPQQAATVCVYNCTRAGPKSSGGRICVSSIWSR